MIHDLNQVLHLFIIKWGFAISDIPAIFERLAWHLGPALVAIAVIERSTIICTTVICGQVVTNTLN